MTPTQRIKHAIMVDFWNNNPELKVTTNITAENVDEIYVDEMVEEGHHWDAESEFRESGTKTGLPCEGSRHYESYSVGTQMPDGSWIGWTYWFGGGKHAEPESMPWMEEAYEVSCIEEEKMTTVRTFSKPELNA